ncbi:MAG: hypothetical protein AAF740_03470 [Bacteroidota bacterium]
MKAKFILFFLVLATACQQPITRSSITTDYNKRSRINGAAFNKPSNLVTTVEEQKKWIRKKYKAESSNYLILTKDNVGYFTLIHRSIKPSFEVKNMDDFRDYITAFGKKQDQDADKVVIQALELAENRRTLNQIHDAYPNSVHSYDLKIKYLGYSRLVKDIIEAAKRYPAIRPQAEEKAAKRTNSLSEIRAFVKAFGKNSSYIEQVFSQTNEQLPRVSKPELIAMLPDTEGAAKARDAYVRESKNLEEFLDGLGKYPDQRIKYNIEEKSASYVRLIADAKLFTEYFGNEGRYADEVVRKVKSRVNRGQISELLELFPNTKYRNELEKSYVQRSASLSSFFSALNEYPRQRTNMDVKAEAKKRTQSLDEVKLLRSYVVLDESESYHIFQSMLRRESWEKMPELILLFPELDKTILRKALNKYTEGLGAAFIAVMDNFNKLKPLEKLTNDKAISKLEQFISKHDGLYDPEGAVEGAKKFLSALETKQKKEYDGLCELYGKPRLIRVKYAVPESGKARKYLQNVERTILGMTYSSMFFTRNNVKKVVVSMAHQEKGVIIGIWYKNSTDGEGLGVFGSKFSTFENDLRSKLRGKGITLVDAEFLGY